ncbi:MAG: hypothetical protein Q4G48_02240 [Bacteroidia bacterium]|nr:hypothetical protein [Bacteroidia bacterium]
MKKNVILLTAIFIAFLLAGCQDEVVQEYKSPGEKIGEEIIELTKLDNISHVKLYNTPYWQRTYAFKINGEIMVVYMDNNRIQHYNLNYVQNFSIEIVGRYVSIWFINPYTP